MQTIAYCTSSSNIRAKIAILSADQTLLGEGTVARTQQDVIFGENQAETLRNARDAAVQGVLSPVTILLLADSQSPRRDFHLAPSSFSDRQDTTLLLCPSEIWAKRPPSPGWGHSVAAPFNYTIIDNTVLHDVPFFVKVRSSRCRSP